MKKGVDYIGVGVGVALFNDEGKILITKRGQKAQNDRGKWEIPGGAVEYGETLEDAAVREIKEENDVDIEVVELLGIYNHLLKEEGQHWVAPTFVCRHVGGEPKIMEPDKCEAVGWYSVDEALRLDLSDITRHNVELIVEKYPNGFR